MKKEFNTPYTLCKVIAIVAIAVMAVACILGCRATKNEGAASVKAQIGTVLQLAYENGGKAAVSNRIERLVVEGKLTDEQAVRLQTLVDIACEKLIEDLAGGEEVEGIIATPVTEDPDGCTDSPPCDVNAAGDDGKTGGAEGATSS